MLNRQDVQEPQHHKARVLLGVLLCGSWDPAGISLQMTAHRVLQGGLQY